MIGLLFMGFQDAENTHYDRLSRRNQEIRVRYWVRWTITLHSRLSKAQ